MRLGSRISSWLSAHPAAVVGAIVVLGALLSWRHTRHAQEWIVMTDELQYLKLGQSFADGSFPIPTLRGRRQPLASVLYPLLISPVLAIFSAPDAHQALHLLNALLVASTAVPVYLLARQVIRARPASYLAAALAVAVPWAATSAVVMTEAAAYPAFAWAVLAMQRALVVPSLRRDLVALAAIGVAFYARTQFVFLAAAFPALVLAHETLFALAARDAAGRRAALGLLRERLLPHAALGATVAVGLVALLAPGSLLHAVLGPFELTVNEGGAVPEGLGSAMRTQVAFVAGGVGFLPLALAAGWSLASLVRPLDRASHAFALLALVTGSALVYIVAVFGLRHAPGPLDRYLFYLAPLLIVATVACLAQGRARPLGLAVGGVFAFWLLRTSGTDFVYAELFVNSQASEFHRVIQGQTYRIGAAFGHGQLSPVALVSGATLAATAAVALLLHRLPRLAPVVVGAPLLILALVQTDYVAKRFTNTINRYHGPFHSVPLDGRDWIDEAVPAGADVAIAPSPVADAWTTQRVWWSAEFWNKRVNRAILLDGFGDHTPFPNDAMSFDRRDGSVRTSNGEQPRFMVFARNQLVFRPQGRVVSEYSSVLPQDPGLELLDLERPYRVSWTAEGMGGDGWIVRGQPARIRVFPREDGRAQRLTARLDLPLAGDTPSRFVLRAGARTADGSARPGSIRGDARVAVCLAPGRLRVAQVSTRARHPLPDGRTVGVHLQGIRVEPVDGGC